MNPQPNSPAVQTSNIPQGAPQAPTAAPIQQPAQASSAPSMLDFAGSLAQASADRFTKLASAMQGAGYIYNPQSGTFVQNQAFLNPLQQAQYNAQYTPQGAAALAQIQANASASAAGDQPVPATQMDNWVNTKTGLTPTDPTMTVNQLKADGYVYLSTGDKQAVDSIKGAQNLLSQIRNASQQINTAKSGTFGKNSDNFVQMLEGGFKDLIGDTAARQLSENLPAQLNTLVQGLGGSQRFNPSQISKLEESLPTPGDTNQQASVKLQNFQTTLNELNDQLLHGTGFNAEGMNNGSQ